MTRSVMKNNIIKLATIAILAAITLFVYNQKIKSKTEEPKKLLVKKVEQKQYLKTYDISNKVPDHLSYPQTIEHLKKWKEEAPDIVEVGVYGKTKSGTDLYYIRINQKDIKNKPTVLYTSCIHGNEPLAAGITMAYIGTLLDGYNKNNEITEIINSRDLYFIPVVSPDSYPISRFVDGVDPNRDFSSPKFPQHKSSPSVEALIDFYWKIRPKAVISGHTFGKLLLTPFGDNYGLSQHDKDYVRIVGRMAEICGYKKIPCAELYSRPISGTEVDWFYRNGSMAVVIEFGSHQDKPTQEEIYKEFKITKDAINLFIKEAPLVSIIVSDNEIDFSKNTGIAHNNQKPDPEEKVPASQY
jgi:hypothetical protein